jgi:hypothetical protein
MKSPTLFAALTAVCLVSAAPLASAQQAKAKPTPAAQARPVLGTAQLPGDNGKLNQAYTMGQQGKLNIVLTGVRYAKSRWIVDGETNATDRDHKLMIVSFQIQNPNNEITNLNDSTLAFTAIDQEGENHEGIKRVIQKSGAKDLNIDLKPAQRIDCETAIVVPAKGVIPKLMVAHRSGGGVLRYDLHDAIKPLEKPYSENGTDAAELIKGEPSTYYTLLDTDARYISTAFQEHQLGANTINDKEIFMLAKMTFKMGTPGKGFMRFEAEAEDENGDRYPATSIRKASTEEWMSSYAEPGQETNGRVSFVVPKGVKIAKFRIWETTRGKSLAVEYPVDSYATVDGQPLANAKPKTNTPAVAGVQASEYATTFRKGDGSTAMESSQIERNENGTKTTAITVAGKQAILVEEADKTTLYLPESGEVLRAPKATDKEPVTSLAYYQLAYANATAPKPKKRSPFGGLGNAILKGGVEGLGSSMMSSDSLSSFGKVAVGKVVEDAAQRTLTNQLGRAIMTSTESIGDGSRSESVAVDKTVYAQTTFKGMKTVDPATLRVDASSAKSVDATTLYKRFAEFMGQGLK